MQDQRTLKERVIDFDLGKVELKYSIDNDCSIRHANRLGTELKRWLAICVINQSTRYDIVGEVDDLWHTFILDTQEYKRLSDEIGFFIHHAPPDAQKTIEATGNRALQESLIKEVQRGYSNFWKDYESEFQEAPSEEYWPKLGDTSDSGDGCGRASCQRCGRAWP